MTKISMQKTGATATKSTKTTATTNRVLAKPPEAVLNGFSATADRFIAASQSSATKRAYASDLKHFSASGRAIPASPSVLAEYLVAPDLSATR